MIKILDGKLWQWGTGRLVQVVPPAGVTVTEVHFCNGTTDTTLCGVLQAQDDGSVVVEIPNILLQTANPLSVYAVKSDPTGECTTERDLFVVWPQSKPADYVYTETEVLSYQALEKRVARLERGGAGGGVVFETDETLTLENGILSVNTADAAEKDNTLPITSAAVAIEVGNIEVLLATI